MLFRDKSAEETFLKNGYLLLPSAGTGVVNDAEIFINSIPTVSNGGLYYSLLAQEPAMNLQIHDHLKKIIHPVLARFLQGFRSLTFSFLIKPPQVKEEFFLHQDWSITDETSFTSATLWMPLCDVDESNGCIFAVPGSHAWFDNHRSQSYPTARLASEGELKKLLVPLPMKKGDLLLFHPALWHGSYGNKTGMPRKVVTALLLPENAPFLHYSLKNSEEALVWRLPDHAYELHLKELAQGHPVKDISPDAVVPYEHQVPEVTQVISKSAVKVVN